MSSPWTRRVWTGRQSSHPSPYTVTTRAMCSNPCRPSVPLLPRQAGRSLRPRRSGDFTDWVKLEGAIAVRIMLAYGVSTDPDHAGVSCIVRAAANCRLPVNLLCWRLLDQAALALAKAHPDTRLIIDDPGLSNPSTHPRRLSPSPTCRPCSRTRSVRMSSSRSQAPARSRTRLTPMTTSGIRSAGSSRPSASTADSGARTGPAPSNSSPTNRTWSRSAGRTG